MHATLSKFEFPQSLLFETEYWCVVLRPQQITLGALVLIAKSDATSFASLPPSAFSDLQIATNKIEFGLKYFRSFDKINYIMLMMVDPQVHFHVVPRYAASQKFDDVVFEDAGWPGQPDFKSVTLLSSVQRSVLQSSLIKAFSAL